MHGKIARKWFKNLAIYWDFYIYRCIAVGKSAWNNWLKTFESRWLNNIRIKVVQAYILIYALYKKKNCYFSVFSRNWMNYCSHFSIWNIGISILTKNNNMLIQNTFLMCETYQSMSAWINNINYFRLSITAWLLIVSKEVCDYLYRDNQRGILTFVRMFDFPGVFV